MSFETSNSSGTLETRFEIPWGADHIQIQTHDADFKVGGGGSLIVGSDGTPGTTVLNSNTFITGTRKLGVGCTDENQTFYPTASMELYRNGSNVEFLIDEDSGTKEARLHLRRGTRDWEIINNNDLAIEVEDDEVFRITNNGNVGIGTTTPTAALEIKNSTSSQPIISLDNAAGTNAVTVLDNGNVGIETASPATSLDVQSSNATVRIGNSTTTPGCIEMYDHTSGALTYVYVDNGSLVATTTKPTFCQ